MFIEKLKSVLTSAADRIAVRSSHGELTYDALNREASAIALALLAQDVGAGCLVAIYGPRRPELLIGMVATMLAGAAYTIVEASGSADNALRRIEQIAPDFVLVFGDDGHLVETTGIPWMSLEQQTTKQVPDTGLNLPTVPCDAPAYVLYTSGSTGSPKGVTVTHANLAHYCDGLVSRLEMPSGMTFAHVSTLSADLGNTCLFVSLWTGGDLYLADEYERKDPAALASALTLHAVDVLKITPTHWRSVFAAFVKHMGDVSPLRWLILGGERLQADLAAQTLESGITRRLVNHYGPTETTIGVTVHPIAPSMACVGSDAAVPIGQPFGQTVLRVRCADGSYRATDCEGELYIGGPSVAQGYWKRADLTAERFVLLDHSQHRYYRSGDRVRIDQEGVITFLGRIDRQVKVNGHRVELEEIEHAVRQLPGVRQAVVVHLCHDDHDYLLCAYEGPSAVVGELRSHVQRLLPSHMVPALFQDFESMPENANGKVDMAALRSALTDLFLKRRTPVTEVPIGDATSVPLESLLLKTFASFLGGRAVSVDDNFFDLGADSLDTVQLVSELQLAGYQVSARSFLACPTVRGLMTTIEGGSAEAVAKPYRLAPQTGPCACGPAQAWFFEQQFTESNRWTQAMLLELGVTLDSELLARAFDRLLENHDSLRARFVRNAHSGAWFFEPIDRLEPVLSTYAESKAPAGRLQELVSVRYRLLEEKLDIYEGRVFEAELLTIGPCQYLLLVAHHLVVDVISWRILLDALMRHYAVESGVEPALHPNPSATLGQWAAHLNENRALFASDIQYWRNQPESRGSGPRVAGIERDAQTAWIALSPEETASVMMTATAAGTKMDSFILARYIEQCALSWHEEVVSVQIESHGRLSLSDEIDVSRTVGWFTSAFPISFHKSEVQEPQFSMLVHERLAGVPNLGHAYSLVSGPRAKSPPYCFNFLGQSRLGLRTDWQAKAVPIMLPGLRGENNDRIYRLKLTGRLADGRLVFDLNFDAASFPLSEVYAFGAAFRQRLVGTSGPQGDTPQPLILQGNSAGALWNIPPEVMAQNGRSGPQRQYSNVLLTGATGFLGIYVLRELLLNTDAHVYCLVRETSQAGAKERLFDAWSAFFGKGEFDSQMHRITVLTGDITQPMLGTTLSAWNWLAQCTDAIYHFASDTRLVGSRRDMEASILCPVREIIRLVEEGKSKDLHYMSTLAVSGIHFGDSHCVFDEASLDIGQAFLNEYERAKYEAECLVRDLVYRGNTAFVYRSGNVTGDSRSSLFQRNADANRWVQCLRAIVRAGHAPRDYSEPIVFSPVDIVARGIVHLSLKAPLTSGTFHVDADNAIPASNFVDAIQAAGIPIKRVEAQTLEDALSASGKLAEPDVALGYFWAARGQRNIRYNNTQTLTLLAHAGITFPQITPEWVRRFVSRLYYSGALGEPQQGSAEEDGGKTIAEVN